MSINLTQSGTASLSVRVAEEIRARMARQRKKQSELARALGVSEQWVSVRLRGVQPIDLNDLERIAAFLTVDIEDLLPPREGRVVTPATSPATLRYPVTPNGQAKTPIPTGPKGPVRPADDKLRVPPSSRRPGRVRSTIRLVPA